MDRKDQIGKMFDRIEAEKAEQRRQAEERERQEAERKRREEEAHKAHVSELLNKWTPVIRDYLEALGERWFGAQVGNRRDPWEKTGWFGKKVAEWTGTVPKYEIKIEVEHDHVMFRLVQAEWTIETRSGRNHEGTYYFEDYRIKKGCEFWVFYGTDGSRLFWPNQPYDHPTPPLSEDALKKTIAELYEAGPRVVKAQKVDR